MERRDFLENVCKYGTCGCAGMMLFSPANLVAEENSPDEKKEDWRIGFMQSRMAKLIGEMDEKVDKDTLSKLLEDMGRYCAQGDTESYAKFKGDLKGYLQSLEKWVETVEHDEAHGVVKLTGKKTKTCFCPFVDISKMPKEFCHCTKGWNKEIYGAITGKQVDVRIDTTVLWGGESCNFTITYT